MRLRDSSRRASIAAMAMDPSPVLVAIREDLARLDAAAAASPPLDEQAMAELYPLLTAAQDALGELAEALEQRVRSGGLCYSVLSRSV